MVTTSKNDTVSSLFLASAAEIDAIFESFRVLHEVYSTSFSNIEKALDGLPVQYKRQVENAHKAFDNTSETVNKRQTKISNQLYAQGLVLLAGSAESITREMFRTLLKLNIRKVNIKKSIDLPLNDVLKAKKDEELAALVLNVLETEGNPTDKLNFQNTKQLQGIMRSYLGIDLADDLMVDLHEYWQIRHIVIHNAGIVDQQCIDNLKKAGISVKRYALNEKIMVTKKDYDKCFALLTLMFESLDSEIERLKLSYNAG